MGILPPPHALIVPASGQGHINGCMLLARSLASVGFSISFVYFSSEYAQLLHKRRLSSPQHPSIHIHVVPDGFQPGQPHFLFDFTPSMRHGLEQLLEQLRLEANPVTCLISDSFVPDTQDVADKFGIPRIEHWTSTAMVYLITRNLSQLYSKGYLPLKAAARDNPVIIDCIECLPAFPLERHYPREALVADPSDILARFLMNVSSRMKTVERVLIHTVSELERDAFEAFRVAQIPAYGVGPLLHHASSSPQPTEHDCTKWLDTQADSSVIYVSFGSYATLSWDEMQELAHGLEASAQPFLWVIRADACEGARAAEVLPEGFGERTKARGKIIEWAPQVKVLEHAAVGGFLTHCGWNSTIESLWAGVPMLGCPRVAEQGSNANYVERVWRVGFEVEKTEEGALARRYVEAGVRRLMQETGGQEARARAKELMGVVRSSSQEGGLSHANLLKFYEDMKLRCA